MTLDTFLTENLTPAIREAGHSHLSPETLPLMREWNNRLADAGWAAPAWPAQYGGRDADLGEQLDYLQRMAAAEAPGPINAIGVANIAPAIMTFGTEEQKARHLLPLLRGDDIWSQGMSEPDAGSDLASLRTAAVADGDDFVINGQKTWNSLGHMADWCQLYVRTDPAAPKHKGISCLLVDMRTPGITARPITTMNGDHSFSELFFSDVRVPRSALLGPQDEGWRVAITTLSHERAGVARLHLSLSRKLDDLLAEPALPRHDARARQQLALLYSRIACMRWMTNRALADSPTGPLGSLTKLAWSRADQELANVAVDMLGIASLTGRWANTLTSSRSISIAGGTTEINKNIVAEHGLGLPR